jgi:hypothetical protein
MPSYNCLGTPGPAIADRAVAKKYAPPAPLKETSGATSNVGPVLAVRRALRLGPIGSRTKGHPTRGLLPLSSPSGGGRVKLMVFLFNCCVS